MTAPNLGINDLESTIQENFRFLARSQNIKNGKLTMNTLAEELEAHSVQIKTIHQQVCFLVTQVVQLREDFDGSRFDAAKGGNPVADGPAGFQRRNPGAGVAVNGYDNGYVNGERLDKLVENEVRKQMQAQMGLSTTTGMSPPLSPGMSSAFSPGLTMATGGQDIEGLPSSKTMEVQQQRMMTLMDVLARQVNSLAKQLSALGRSVTTQRTANPSLVSESSGTSLGTGAFGFGAGQSPLGDRPFSGETSPPSSQSYSGPPGGGGLEPLPGTSDPWSQWFGRQWFASNTGTTTPGMNGWTRDALPRSDGASTMSQIVELDRSRGESLGLDLDGTSEGSSNADFLMIIGIQDGLVKTWNVYNRERDRKSVV